MAVGTQPKRTGHNEDSFLSAARGMTGLRRLVPQVVTVEKAIFQTVLNIEVIRNS